MQLIKGILQKKGKVLVTVFFCIMHSMSSVAVTIALQRYLDYSSDMLGMAPLRIVLTLGCVLIWSIVSLNLNNYFYDTFEYDLKEFISLKLYHKISSVPYEYFENTQFLDELKKGKEGIEGYLSLSALVFMLLFFYIPYFVVLEMFYLAISPRLVLIVLATFLPDLLAQVLRVRLYVKLEDKTGPLLRKYKLYEQYLTERTFCKECRTSGAGSYFKHCLKETMSELAKLKTETELASAGLQVALKAITLTGLGISLFILIVEFKNDSISVGAFAGVFQSLFLSLAYIDEIVSYHFGEISKKIGKVRNYNLLYNRQFQQIPLIISGVDDVENVISVSDVTYQYPGSNEFALQDINFTVKAGETIAIVGYNGSGKTTLAKILLGLLQPTSGSITYSSQLVNKNLASENFHLSSSALFQDYQRYKLTVRRNVAIGSGVTLEEDSSSGGESALLEKVGLSSSLFPLGFDTLLAPEFGGVDISGGQWQRIALARGMCKEHQLLILDEPTSAIDPLEETQLYNLFKEMGADKNMFIVTHRIGATRLADRILVLDRGRLVEYGTQDELLDKHGMYYKIYHEQIKWYNRS